MKTEKVFFGFRRGKPNASTEAKIPLRQMGCSFKLMAVELLVPVEGTLNWRNRRTHRLTVFAG